jgi:hypothetical protein
VHLLRVLMTFRFLAKKIKKFIFQGLTIIAFNDGSLNGKTLREVLSLGPTFVVMKFFESKFHLLPPPSSFFLLFFCCVCVCVCVVCYANPISSCSREVACD